MEPMECGCQNNYSDTAKSDAAHGTMLRGAQEHRQCRNCFQLIGHKQQICSSRWAGEAAAARPCPTLHARAFPNSENDTTGSETDSMAKSPMFTMEQWEEFKEKWNEIGMKELDTRNCRGSGP
jgi:hypothetical protein